ncbi:MAG: chorismate mutase [Gemmatimonadota bacterium]
MIAIRGAIRIQRNDRDSIYHETQRLLREMERRNGFTPDRIVSALFTMTPDLNADFPAYAARSMGWIQVPMLGAQESAVPGALDRMLRVLLHVDVEGPARHVYLGEAASMRPDLADEGDAGPAAVSGRADALEPGDAEEPGDVAVVPHSAGSRAGTGPILIAGLGLIGGSVALALERGRAFLPILGQDPDPRALEVARAAGAIADGDRRPGAYLDRASIVLLAMPVERIVSWLGRWGGALRPGTVVLDVGSTKETIVAAMEGLPEGVEAIGAHPMAGSELSGMGAARPDLFEGSTWALVETARTAERAREVATAIVEAVGARPLFLDAEAHDRATAVTSHLPYVLSAALALQAAASEDTAVAALVGPGLRDMTRLAASDPSLMAGILATNWPHVREAVRDFRQGLDRLVAELEGELGSQAEGSRDPADLREVLHRLRAARESLFGG